MEPTTAVYRYIGDCRANVDRVAKSVDSGWIKQ